MSDDDRQDRPYELVTKKMAGKLGEEEDEEYSNLEIWERPLVKKFEDNKCVAGRLSQVEPREAFNCFQEYLYMNYIFQFKGRSISALVRLLKKKYPNEYTPTYHTLKAYSKKWDWDERANAYDMSVSSRLGLENRSRIVHSQTDAAISTAILANMNKHLSSLASNYLKRFIDFENQAESDEEVNKYIKNHKDYVKHLKDVSNIPANILNPNLKMLGVGKSSESMTFIGQQASLTFNTSKGDLAAAVREAFGLKPREQILDEKEEREKKIKENNDTDLYEDDFIEAQIIEDNEEKENIEEDKEKEEKRSDL